MALEPRDERERERLRNQGILNERAAPDVYYSAAPRGGVVPKGTTADARVQREQREVPWYLAKRQGTTFAPKYDPTQASRPAQRYLSAAGWGKGLAAPAGSEDWVDRSTFKTLGPHRYSLTKWQQEQAGEAYGVQGPEEPVQLTGDSFRTGRANLADYESLTPQQQTAMRFNEMLINATEADRRAAVAPENQDPGYKARVSEMFGSEGGSQVYAPNTMALLESMKMGRLRGQDLDEYISLDRAYDVDEIKSLQPWDTTPTIDVYRGYGVSHGRETQTAIDRRQIDMAGNFIEEALARTDVRGWNEQARIDAALGRRPAPEQIPFGWLNKDEARPTEEETRKELLYQNMYDYLSSNRAENMDVFWEETKARNFTDEDYNEIYDYFYLKSLEDDRTGTPEGYRTGAETRSFLGIGG